MSHSLPTANTQTEIVQQLGDHGYACVLPPAFSALIDVPLTALHALDASWNDLPRDNYLRDGGHYRARRHGSFVQDCAAHTLTQAPHRAHWQPVDYNALHGGIERWYEPVRPDIVATRAWQHVILRIGEVLRAHTRAPRWFIEAHQFRIDTAGGVGRPTPEGAHRDGVDFVAVILVQRGDMKGGESRVFEADGPNGVRFTLTQAWTLLLLDDHRVIHETTPIQPAATAGVRDTLVITYRREGFLDPV